MLPPVKGDLGWVFTITANRFLRNMVRAIVGTLIEVGRGRLTVEEFCQVIERKDRCSAGDSVPGHALFLTNITYPAPLFISPEGENCSKGKVITSSPRGGHEEGAL